MGAELATSVFDLGSPGVVSPAPPVGEAARHFRGRLLRHWQRANLPGSVELWRDGKILGGILAAGGAPVANDVTVSHYAAVQQTGVPVYWLGEEFKSGPRLTSYFLDAFPRGYFRMAKEQRMTTQYDTDLFLDS